MSELENTNNEVNVNSENEAEVAPVENETHAKSNNTLDAEYEIINKNKNDSFKITPIAVICGILAIIIVILGCMCVYTDTQRREAIKTADKLISEVSQLTEDKENLEDELNSLQKQYDTLEGQYNDLDKAYLELVDKNNNNITDGNTSGNNESTQEVENKPAEYVFKEENGVYKITANEIVKVFKADKKQLKPLVNHEVEITGKVKSYEYADSTTILNKKVEFPATIKLDSDDLKSFKGIDCEFKDKTINSLIANNQDTLNDNCYVRIKGTADLGIIFLVNDCYSIEILDASGNVLESWASNN